MPYDYTTPDGIQLKNIPDSMKRDSPELQQIIAEERASRQQAPTPSLPKMRAPEPVYDPAEGMSTTERALANVGAGMADLYTGGKQIYNKMFGSEADQQRIEEEIAEKRALDERLAQTVKGGKLLQVAGNVIPTLAIPAGGFARGAGWLLEGGALGARVLPKALQAGKLGNVAIDSALAGAAGGALQPIVGDESRLANTAIGAGLGAAFPLTLGAGRGLYRRFIPEGGRARAVRQLETQGGVTPQQAQRMQQEIENSLRQQQQRLQQGQPPDVPLSTAAQLENPELARLEAGSRAKSGANWYDFDQDQAAAVNQAFLRATSEAEEIAARRGARSTAWDTNWQQAAQHADPNVFRSEVQGLRDYLEQAMRSPDAVSSDVRRAIREIQETLDRSGDALIPRHLQVARRELSGGIKPTSQNPLKQVSREEPAIRSLTSELDRILNETTGGRFDPVLEGYTSGSRLVEAARGAGKVRGAYYEPTANGLGLGRVLGTSADVAGDVPLITQHGLGRAMSLAKGPSGTTTLSAQSQRGLNDLLAALRKQDIVKGVKRSATGGGGSNTAGDIMAMRTGEQLMGQAPSLGAQLLKVGTQALDAAANAHRDRALAAALQNPREMHRLLDQVIRSGQPLTGFEHAVLNALRGTSAGVGTAAAQVF